MLYVVLCMCVFLEPFSSYFQDAFLFVFGLLLGVFAKKGGFIVDGCNNKQYLRDARGYGMHTVRGESEETTLPLWEYGRWIAGLCFISPETPGIKPGCTGGAGNTRANAFH